MAAGGLEAVRDALIVAHAEDMIDDEEFVLLYEYNQATPVFPYWKFQGFNLETWDDVECNTELRFEKKDLPTLMRCLQIPEELVCEQGTVCSGMESLCIFLKRLAYPCRYTDMVYRFGRSPSELCVIFSNVLDIVYATHHHRLDSWDQPFLSPDQLHNYAQAVHQRGAPLQNCFGFIDGTVRKIARPKYHQRVMYNGHKRVHAIKFQSIVLPNGLIANLSGPYEGKRHDSTMLHESRVLPNLRQVAFHNGVPLCLYGDPAYPLGVHLQGPFREPALTPEMQAYNKAMSELRVSVEWMFGNITKFFSFVDFKRQMKIHLSAIGKMYVTCALLENTRTCLYGNIVSTYFGLPPPTLHEYFW